MRAYQSEGFQCEECGHIDSEFDFNGACGNCGGLSTRSFFWRCDECGAFYGDGGRKGLDEAERCCNES